MSAPIIYMFDYITGEFQGTKEARPSPMGDGYLLPHDDHESRTLIVPPQAQANKVRRFNRTTQEWEQVEDFRSQNVYTASGAILEPSKIQIGPLPDGVTLEPRPSEWHEFINGQWVENIEKKTVGEARQLRQTEFFNDLDRQEMVAKLKTTTPAEIDTWLTNNVTNLAQARQVLGKILKILALSVR